jgi:hypothetical protein
MSQALLVNSRRIGDTIRRIPSEVEQQGPPTRADLWCWRRRRAPWPESDDPCVTFAGLQAHASEAALMRWRRHERLPRFRANTDSPIAASKLRDEANRSDGDPLNGRSGPANAVISYSSNGASINRSTVDTAL